MSEQRLRINTENVVHEEVDGEVIAIDLSGGSYYSLAGSGPAIWAQLEQGATEAEICMALTARFEVDGEMVRGQVSELLGELLESGLATSVDADVSAPPNVGVQHEGAEQPPYEPPRFERYTDMKDYFLLDPIHEVDTAGWPRPAA